MVSFPDSTLKLKKYCEVLSNSNLTVSPTFFRRFNCPERCGACCPKFSLDYFGERWLQFKQLYPQESTSFLNRFVNGVEFFTDYQKENNDHFCKFLNKTNGRCKIHQANPLSCRVEIIKFIKTKNRSTIYIRKFGRGWNMLNLTGCRGTMCSFQPLTRESYNESVNLLTEIQNLGEMWKYNMLPLEKTILNLKKEPLLI